MVLAATKREQILIKQKLKSNPPQSFPMPIDHRTESMPGIPAAIITTPTNNTRVENSEFVKGTAHNTEGEQYYLWLVLYDYNANRHYPQDGPVAVSSDGQWGMTYLLRASEGMILLQSLQTKTPTRFFYNTKRPVSRELIILGCLSFPQDA
jgi:hypothetical protein